MKLKIETTSARNRISWFTDAGVCIATADSDSVEIAGYAQPRIRDAAQAAYRELHANPNADLRHYEGMTLPRDPEVATMPGDRKVVQCNYTEDISSVAQGARAYVVYPNEGWASERICVLARSRSGRWIEKWEDVRRLGNFRVKTLPPEHPLYSNERLLPAENADRLLANVAPVEVVDDECE